MATVNGPSLRFSAVKGPVPNGADAVKTREVGHHRQRRDGLEVERRFIATVRIDRDVAHLVRVDHAIHCGSRALGACETAEYERTDERHE